VGLFFLGLVGDYFDGNGVAAGGGFFLVVQLRELGLQDGQQVS